MKTREMHRSSVRRTALLLFLSMLLSVFTFFPSYAVTENDTETENTATEPEQIESEEQIFARITADSFLLNYIDEDSFRATGHVNRLPEEEDLNSYVFENADGTRTAYILAEPVKYVDSTGAVKEKNLTLSTGSIGNASVMAAAVNTNAYTVTDTNTPMTFPNDLSQGVSFTYGEYTVTLCPETVNTAATVMQADGKVLYRNAFGTTAHLMYTPQLNGLKEDIVLTSYNGTNSFSFILNTDGLIPASDAGGYYLWDGNTPETQIRLGQVVSYDTNGDFSIGEMTVEHHAAADDMARALTKSRQIAILFSGHDLCTGENDGNESPDVLGVQISLAEELHTISSVCVVEKDDLSTVVHELGHVFGANDHYGRLGNPDANYYNNVGDQISEEDLKYYFGPNVYSVCCLYGELPSSTPCEGCRRTIEMTINESFS